MLTKAIQGVGRMHFDQMFKSVANRGFATAVDDVPEAKILTGD